MNVIETELPGVFILQPKVFSDSRGYFLETWNQARYREAGIMEDFVQDNLSYSTRGVLRGLHFQNPNAQSKLLYVLQGEVFDVSVDIRVGSPTFGQWVGTTLSGDNKRQLYVGAGVAHGFCVTSETAILVYKCTDFYNPAAEGSILWNDPDIGIEWPVSTPALSDKDRHAPRLKDIPRHKLPASSA